MQPTETILFHTLLQLALIVLAGRFGGWLAQRCRQSVAVGEIIVGIVLGPSLFGLLWPEAFAAVSRSTPPLPLTLLSQIGLLLLMFQIGLEFDFAHLREPRNRRAVAWVAVAGIAAPFGLGLLFSQAVPAAYAGDRHGLVFGLFFATAMSITALPILGRIMVEFGLTRAPIGVIAISAAAINDVVGWFALAMVTMLATAAFDPQALAGRIVAVLAFALAAWWLLRPVLGRWVDREMARDPAVSPTLMGGILAAVFLAGMCTFRLGIFAIFGGFLLGVLLHDRLAFVAAWKERVGRFVDVFFVPIFFTYIGLRTDIGSLAGWNAWAWCAGVIAVATIGKFGGCYVAARCAGLPPSQARVLGVMMNTRALMELIVVNAGYDLGVIGRPMFTMLVLMAIVSTVITAPALRRWLPAIGAWRHAPMPPDAVTRRWALGDER